MASGLALSQDVLQHRRCQDRLCRAEIRCRRRESEAMGDVNAPPSRSVESVGIISIVELADLLTAMKSLYVSQLSTCGML